MGNGFSLSIGLDEQGFGINFSRSTGQQNSTPPRTNLLLWLDSQIGITKDGSDIISSWNDQSGNGNHAIQTGGTSLRPIYVTGAFANSTKPGVQFDGSSDWLSGSLSITSSVCTLYVVSKTLTIPGAGGVFSLAKRTGGGADISDIDLFSYYQAAGANLILYRNDRNAVIAHPGTGSIKFVSVTFNGLSGSMRRLSSITSGTINGISASVKPTSYIIGCQWGPGPINYSREQYAEILFYNVAHDLSTRTSILTYLSGKWAPSA